MRSTVKLYKSVWVGIVLIGLRRNATHSNAGSPIKPLGSIGRYWLMVGSKRIFSWCRSPWRKTFSWGVLRSFWAISGGFW